PARRPLRHASPPHNHSPSADITSGECGRQVAVIGTSEVALRTPSLSSAIWYISVVLGWGLCGIAVFEVVTAPITTSGAPLAMIAVLLVALELLPLAHGRGHDPPGVVISTAFVCAML